MRIQRIDVCGFKSFNERAVIQFDEGVTGIVGPNGCGKSNVVDAIRWVMGEQSAKHLRGRSMEDVIFAGSETQGASGMAEVALTLRNDRHTELPPQYQGFAEITVARRLYRDGRSEYLINKAPCRLLDITELFLGTGVGTRAYSIIEQGRVGLIVNSKPEERRALLEEAAGITKYKARKRMAERKLDYTEQNLLRVGDIVGEMRRQLGSLERQARKAERYRELKDEIREIELHGAAVDWLEARASRTHLGLELAGQLEVTQRGEAEVERLEGEREEFRQTVSAGESVLEALRAKAHALELEIQRLVQARGFAEQQVQELQDQRGALGRETAEAEARLSLLEAERAGLTELLGTIDEALARDQSGQGELEATAADAVAREAALRALLEAERGRFAEAETRAAGFRSRLLADGRRQTELEARAARLQADLVSVESRRAEVSAALELCTGQTAETVQLRLQLTSRRAEVEASLAQARVRFEENEKVRRQVRDELLERRSRLRSLEEVHRNLEGHERGVRSLLQGADGQPAIAGLRGVLADTFQAPQAIEQALEAFLADRLQHLVVDDDQTAQRGAAYLGESQGGRATFLPLNMSVLPVGEPQASAGCLGRALDLVQTSAGAESVVGAVLSDVWIFETLAAALAARTAGAPGHLVTLAGEVLWASGALTAGVLEGAGIGALSQRREIDQLTHLVADLDGRLEVAQQRHAELSRQIASEDGILKSLNKDSQAQEVALAHQQQDVRRMTEQLASHTHRAETLSAEQSLAQKSLDELVQESGLAREGLAQAEAVAREAGERLERQTQGLKELAAEAASARERLTELKVKIAGDLRRSEATRAQLERNDALKRELTARAEAAVLSAAASQERSTRLAEEIAAGALRAEALRLEIGEASAQIGVEGAAQAERVAGVSALETRLRAARAQIEAARAALGKTQLREREVSLSLEHLVSMARDRHAVELTLEVSRFHLLPLPPASDRERLGSLRESVAKMGEINLTAIQEHQELNSRHEVLSQQKLDLERSVAQLREAIVRINRTSRERFRETFELVNARFAEVFPRLFRGGKAGLQLIEEGGDVLEAGVEIFAQPPGKKLQSVNLLSGGEKALTAVALIFAIFLIKPTPFCLLDEVDAPLDEGNVGRYNDLVREISKISQFILITHNKRTMEIADTLYGVTMEEPGCSKLVSVKLNGSEAQSVAA